MGVLVYMETEEIKEIIKDIDDLEEFDFWREIAQDGNITTSQFGKNVSKFVKLYLKYETEGFD